MADQPDGMEMILQDCLEKIQSGQSTLDAVLAAHPELVEELRPALEAALWFCMHKATLDPRPGFIAASNHRVLEQINQEQLAGTQSLLAAEESGFTRFLQKLTGQRRYVFQAALVIVVLFVMVAGSGGIVTAAQRALPGDVLFRVKTTLENAELAFAQGEASKAELHIRLAQRRLVEIQALISQDRLGDIPKTITLFEEHVNQAIHHMIAVSEKDQERASALAASLQSTLQEQIGIFSQLAESALQPVKEQIERIVLVSTGMISLVNAAVPEIIPPGLAQDALTPTPTLSALKTQGLIHSTEIVITSTPIPAFLPSPSSSLTPVIQSTAVSEVSIPKTPTMVITFISGTEEGQDKPTKPPKSTHPAAATITWTATPTSSSTVTPNPTRTPTSSPTPTLTVTPASSSTSTPGALPTETGTASPPSPSATWTSTPTTVVVPSVTPSTTPTPYPTNTPVMLPNTPIPTRTPNN